MIPVTESKFSLFLFGSLLSSAVAAVVLTVIMFNENRYMYLEHEIRLAQLESENRGARLRALQSQIDPHFVHNTLTAMIGLIKLHRTDTALICMQAFSRMLRYNYGAGDMVSLEKEVEYTQNYLSIQSVRFGDRFSTTVDVDESIYKVRIPPLTIQPLVENAIEHAWSGDTLMRLTVSGRLCGENVVLEILDNGVGMSQAEIAEFKDKQSSDQAWSSNHVGLMNVQRRLELVFGASCGITVQSLPQGGTVVRLTIPSGEVTS